MACFAVIIVLPAPTIVIWEPLTEATFVSLLTQLHAPFEGEVGGLIVIGALPKTFVGIVQGPKAGAVGDDGVVPAACRETSPESWRESRTSARRKGDAGDVMGDRGNPSKVRAGHSSSDERITMRDHNYHHIPFIPLIPVSFLGLLAPRTPNSLTAQ